MQKVKMPNCIEETVTSMFNHGTISYQTDLLTFDFDFPIEEYFKLILPSLLKNTDNRTENEKELIFGFFSYFKDFIHLMINLNGSSQYQYILKTMIGYMSCTKYPKNKIITQQGDKITKIYLMLSGTADVVMPKRYQYALRIDDYYRYLAKLIAFKEYELLSRVLFENSQIHPVEILDCGCYGRINGYKINHNDNKDSPAVNAVSVSDLEMCLTHEDKKFISRLTKNTLNSELSIKEYIERLSISKHNKVFTSNDDDNFTPEFNDTIFTLYIYNYILQGSISGGHNLNDLLLVNAKSIRTSTIISTSICYFSIITKEKYLCSIKKTNSRCDQKLLMFILSSNIFAGNTAGLMSVNYKKYFQSVAVNKNDYVLYQNELNDNVIILKEGSYELTLVCSISCIGKIVTGIYGIMKQDKKNNSCLVDELAKAITRLNDEEKIIKEKQYESQLFDLFYSKKRRLRLYTLSAPDYYGFQKLELNPKENCFSLQCISSIGEYLEIDKSKYYSISSKDRETKSNEALFCFQKNEKLIKRLLTIRNSLLQIFLHKHSLAFLSKKETNLYNQKKDDKPISFLITRRVNLNNTKSMLSLKVFDKKKPKLNVEIKRKNSAFKPVMKKSIRVSQSLIDNHNNHHLGNSLSNSNLIDTTFDIKSIDTNKFNYHIEVGKCTKQSRKENELFSMSNEYENRDNLIKCSLKSRLFHNSLGQFDLSTNKSISVEHYNEFKNHQYRMKRNYYTVKATRDYFSKAKKAICLCKKGNNSIGIILNKRSTL